MGNIDLAAFNAQTPIPIMKFTLTYDGELRASGNKPKPEDKWAIRRQIAPQLAELWQVSPVLKNLEKQAPADDRRYTPQEMYHTIMPTFSAIPLDHMDLCHPMRVDGI